MTVYGVIIYDNACARNIFLSPPPQMMEKNRRVYYSEKNTDRRDCLSGGIRD